MEIHIYIQCMHLKIHPYGKSQQSGILNFFCGFCLPQKCVCKYKYTHADINSLKSPLNQNNYGKQCHQHNANKVPFHAVFHILYLTVVM